LIDLVVPEPQNSKAAVSEMTVARGVAHDVRVIVVLTAIDFDNQSKTETNKIQDKPVAWSLSSEMKAARFP
jgi:hypothetical protein